jgi:cytochrome c-type biogenesis protein CcsB
MATIFLLIIYAAGLSGATFIEKYHGTEVAKMLIYLSPVFIFLQFTLVVNFVLVLFKRNYIGRKKWAFVVIHASFAIILAGAMTTHVFGREGSVHIREGEKTNRMVIHTTKGVTVEELPFLLELTEFRMTRYPGSSSPSAFESDLRIHVDGEARDFKIFMNNVLDLKGYRFFQASYDEDEMGTILSVNKDVAGRTITYIGYTLLIIGFVMIFFVRNSRYRHLLGQLSELRRQIKTVSAVVLFSIVSLSAFGHPPSTENSIRQNIVDAEHAANFGALPIQWRGRTMPMNTFSSEVLRKVHRRQTFGDINSDQFLLSIFAMPQMWTHVPLIAIPNKEVSRRYNLPENHSTYIRFFDMNGQYRFSDEIQRIHAKPAVERTAYERELIQIDERVNIIYLLLNYRMPNIFPNPANPSHDWYTPGEDLSDFRAEDSLFVTQTFAWYLNEVQHAVRNGNWTNADNVLNVIKAYQLENCDANLISADKIQAELRYNRIRFFDFSKFGYFILGGLLLAMAFAQLFRERRWLRYLSTILTAGIILVFLFHAFGMGMRWYISGHAPWSNFYETMVYVSWVTVLAGLIFGRKNKMMLSLSTLFSGIILFVSTLNWMDPQISTLVPVLNSPWLMIHVSVNVAAYGFFGVSFLLGIVNMVLMILAKNSLLIRHRIKELTIINNLTLLIGLILMTVGAFLGGVWANESWGRYWGWDPKETWALITIVVYTIVTHLYLIKNSDWLVNLLSVFAFSSVLMTYFGVNYILSGMHSYGNTDGNIMEILMYAGIVFLGVGVLGFISAKAQKREGTKGKSAE